MKLLSYFILFCLAVTVRAQAPASLGQLSVATTKTPVLAGRLTLSVPSQAKSEALQHGIMSAPQTDYEQTRIVIDAGKSRMVLMAYEEFARLDGDLETAVRKISTDFPMKVSLQKWPLPGAPRAEAYIPAAPTKDHEANLVMGVYVVQGDGTVQRFDWYVNPAGAAQWHAALNLAKSMAKTISPGDRKLESTAGLRELPAFGNQDLFVTVPNGFVATTQPGPDFLVDHIRKITSLGAETASMGIYFGSHPSKREGSPEKATSTLFGKRAEWYKQTTTEDGLTTISLSALVSLGSISADVFLSAADAPAIEELKSIASTLRLGAQTPRH